MTGKAWTLRGRSTETVEAVYRQRHAEFLRVASAITGDAESGRDAVQEGLARALARRSSFRGAGTLEAWLWKVVVNAARNARRSRDRADIFEQTARPVDEPDARAASIRAAVAALPERQRLVLFLRYYADLDYAAIARVLGVRRGTVSATLSQAHAAVRRLLAEEVRS
jgi:RNA polymerase sigma factor (sigma-70 family)